VIIGATYIDRYEAQFNKDYENFAKGLGFQNTYIIDVVKNIKLRRNLHNINSKVL